MEESADTEEYYLLLQDCIQFFSIFLEAIVYFNEVV